MDVLGLGLSLSQADTKPNACLAADPQAQTEPADVATQPLLGYRWQPHNS